MNLIFSCQMFEPQALGIYFSLKKQNASFNLFQGLLYSNRLILQPYPLHVLNLQPHLVYMVNWQPFYSAYLI